MDPSDLCVTPGSGGSSSSDGTTSSSSASPYPKLDHNLQDVLIKDGVLVDNGPSAPSSTRSSVSFVDNGLGNRRSASMSHLILVSSGSQGSSGGGRSGFGSQFYQRRNREEPRGTQPQRNRYYEGSSNRWQAGPSNLQQGQQLSLPYSMQQQYPFHMTMTPLPYFSPWLAGAGPPAAYTYAPAAVTVQPEHYNYNQPGGASGGMPPVDIRRPDGTPLPLPPPPPARRPVAPLVINAPPANGGRTSAAERPETQPPPPWRTAAPTARAFSWPPTVEEESAIWYALNGTGGTRRRARLPVFRGICSDGAEGQAPPPSPLCP